MRRRGRRHGGNAILLALVLGGVLAGLVGMHHLAMAPAPTAAAAPFGTSEAMAPMDVPQPAPEHGGGDHTSTLLHLCLAVLTAAAMLAVVLLLWPRPFGPVLVPGLFVARVDTASRAPPLTAPQRLALLCVSRT